jgi:hypothetical protein
MITQAFPESNLGERRQFFCMVSTGIIAMPYYNKAACGLKNFTSILISLI